MGLRVSKGVSRKEYNWNFHETEIYFSYGRKTFLLFPLAILFIPSFPLYFFLFTFGLPHFSFQVFFTSVLLCFFFCSLDFFSFSSISLFFLFLPSCSIHYYSLFAFYFFFQCIFVIFTCSLLFFKFSFLWLLPSLFLFLWLLLSSLFLFVPYFFVSRYLFPLSYFYFLISLSYFSSYLPIFLSFVSFLLFFSSGRILLYFCMCS